MPICIPEEPEFRTRSERKVWNALHALVAFLEGRGLDASGWCTWMVALPSTTLSKDFDSAQMPRSRMIDASQIQQLAITVEWFALRSVRRRPTAIECAAVVELLTGRREPEPDELDPVAYPELVCFGWSADEVTAIQELRRSARIRHRYPAGLGRAYLAIERALRCIKALRRVCHTVQLG